MSDDITFCSNWDCNRVKSCDVNPKNICHHDIPHSFADYAGTEYCPKEKAREGASPANKKRATRLELAYEQIERVYDELCKGNKRDRTLAQDHRWLKVLHLLIQLSQQVSPVEGAME